jgi:hypothetical protein
MIATMTVVIAAEVVVINIIGFYDPARIMILATRMTSHPTTHIDHLGLANEVLQLVLIHLPLEMKEIDKVAGLEAIIRLGPMTIVEHGDGTLATGMIGVHRTPQTWTTVTPGLAVVAGGRGAKKTTGHLDTHHTLPEHIGVRGRGCYPLNCIQTANNTTMTTFVRTITRQNFCTVINGSLTTK